MSFHCTLRTEAVHRNDPTGQVGTHPPGFSELDLSSSVPGVVFHDPREPA